MERKLSKIDGVNAWRTCTVTFGFLVGLINHSFALVASFRSLSVTLARIAFDIRFTGKLVFRIAATAGRCTDALPDSIFDRSFAHNDEWRAHSRRCEFVHDRLTCLHLRHETLRLASSVGKLLCLGKFVNDDRSEFNKNSLKQRARMRNGQKGKMFRREKMNYQRPPGDLTREKYC